jgi:hypothetical protein
VKLSCWCIPFKQLDHLNSLLSSEKQNAFIDSSDIQALAVGRDGVG